MTLKRAMEIGLSVHFGGMPVDLDSISIEQAQDALLKATNKWSHSETLKAAYAIVRAEIDRQHADVRDERPVTTPADPELPKSPHVTASWRDTRVWK